MPLPSFSLSVGAPEVVMTPAQRAALGKKNGPDGSPFFWRHRDAWKCFAAYDGSMPDGGAIGLTAPDLRSPWRADNPDPTTGHAVPCLQNGSLQPAPDGDYDVSYAGFGPVHFDHGTLQLLSIYHAEKHWLAGPTGLYACLGSAVSVDAGKTFQKLGLAIRPCQPDDGVNPVTTSSGTLAHVLDADGEWLLCVYMDTDFSLGKTSFPALARTSLPEAFARAKQGQPPAFWKWCDGGFTEPGVGGRFTPLFSPPHAEWCRWPVLLWDSATSSWLVFYAAGTEGVEVRESIDLKNWSDPLWVIQTPPEPNLNYVGVAPAGLSPRNYGLEIWLYYTSGFYPGVPGFWQQAEWRRAKVTLAKN